ncbi:MAG: HAD hydrolase family protein [Rhodanobacter sp.]
MNARYLTDLPAGVLSRAEAIRVAVFDVDGTLTDGRLQYGGADHDTRRFHVHDGLGLKRLQEHGVQVAIITARHSQAVALRADDLGIHHVFQAQRDKRACLLALLETLNLQPFQACYAGDDLPDLRPMQIAGLAVAVANAHPWVLERAHWQTSRRGGDGAVREVCDLILHAQGRAAAEQACWQ